MTREEIVKNAKSIKNHLEVVEKYNSLNPLPAGYKLQYNDAWCAATVSVIFADAGYMDIAECSCLRMRIKAKQLGIWQDTPYIPDIGDIIMYDWNKDGIPDHVGVITDTNYKFFYFVEVLEGNYNNSIGVRNISLEASSICGYITPPYNIEDKDIFQTVTEFFDTLK